MAGIRESLRKKRVPAWLIARRMGMSRHRLYEMLAGHIKQVPIDEIQALSRELIKVGIDMDANAVSEDIKREAENHWEEVARA